jgi:hypothetical protein
LDLTSPPTKIRFVARIPDRTHLCNNGSWVVDEKYISQWRHARDGWDVGLGMNLLLNSAKMVVRGNILAPCFF